MFARNAIPVAKRLVAINSRGIAVSAARPSGHEVEHIDKNRPPPLFHKQPTMDDLPQPCGSWQEYYDQKQKKYNMQLFFGVSAITVALITLWSSGIFRNILTPSKPWPSPVP